MTRCCSLLTKVINTYTDAYIYMYTYIQTAAITSYTLTNTGIAYGVKAFQVPLGSRTSKGTPLPQVLPINSEEKVCDSHSSHGHAVEKFV